MPVAIAFSSNLLLQIKDVLLTLDINSGTLEVDVSNVFAVSLSVSVPVKVGSGKIDDFINMHRTQTLILLRGFLMRSIPQKCGFEKKLKKNGMSVLLSHGWLCIFSFFFSHGAGLNNRAHGHCVGSLKWATCSRIKSQMWGQDRAVFQNHMNVRIPKCLQRPLSPSVPRSQSSLVSQSVWY